MRAERQTDRQTDTQTRRSQYFAPLPGRSNNDDGECLQLPLSACVDWLLVKRVRAAVPVRRFNSHDDVHVDTQVPVTGQSVPSQSQHTLCGRHDGR